jgi:transposase
VTGTALLAIVGDDSQFASGRQMAASLGLTPKRDSSGGKERLLGISKRDDADLRSLLVHGARATSLHTNLSRFISANSGGEVHHPLQAGPDGFDAGFAVALTPQETAEASDEAYHGI